MKTIHENLPLLDPTLCRRNKKKKKKKKKKKSEKKNLGRKHKTSRPTDGMPNHEWAWFSLSLISAIWIFSLQRGLRYPLPSLHQSTHGIVKHLVTSSQQWPTVLADLSWPVPLELAGSEVLVVKTGGFPLSGSSRLGLSTPPFLNTGFSGTEFPIWLPGAPLLFGAGIPSTVLKQWMATCQLSLPYIL